MGKLLALELFNFKSYKGHHVLQFGDSYFTSIIGPNGSGKSNSMDAISFVLGIKSSHLRSTHLKDLIYRGRVLKHAKIDADGTATEEHTNGDVDGNGEMETDTQASTQRNDPTTAWVMAVYDDDAGEEQRWKRTITSSGASEYRINNRVVTAKQYNEALEAENILIRARNFLVFQGDVEAIASQSPADLTRLIEQISGSLEYKKDYERLKAEKEQADDEVTHRAQMRRGINGEVKQYQEQKAELDRFEKLREERDQERVTQILWKLFHLQRTIEESSADIQRHQDELQEFRRKVKKYEERLEQARGEQAKVGREVGKYERQIKNKEKTIRETENELDPINEKLSLTNSKIKQKKKTVADISTDRDEQQKSVTKLQGDISTVKKAQKRWEDEWRAKQQQAGRQLTENDLKEYQRLRGEVSKRCSDSQFCKEGVERQLKTEEATVSSLKSKLDRTQSTIDALQPQVNGLKERHAEFKGLAKSTSKKIEQTKKTINEKTSERERARQILNELEEKHFEVLRKLDEAQGAERESKRDAHQRDMLNQVKRLFPSGVKGLLRELCKPKQKKYESAIVTVFGRHWDSVIVDTAKTAQDCCQYLKEQRLGRLTFIPLDTVINEQPNANFRGMQPGVRLAVDTVDYDSNIERAVSFVCGSAIVTDTLDIARKVCYSKGIEVKAVALDGTVIHKGGNMTGGEDPSDKKRRFETLGVDKLRDLEQKYRNDIAALPKGHKNTAEEEELVSELDALQEKLKYQQEEMKTLDRNIESTNRELAHAKSQLPQDKKKYDEGSNGVENLREALDQLASSIDTVEDDVFGAFCQRLDYENIREYDAQQGSMQAEAEKRKNEFIAQISKLENKLHFEDTRLKTTTTRIATNETEIKRDQQIIADLESQKEQLASEVDTVNAEIEQLNEQLAELRQQHEERGKIVAQAREELNKKNGNVQSALKEITDLEAAIETASAARHTQLRTCKVENIDIPLEEGSRKLTALPMDDELLAEKQADEEDAMDIDPDEEGTARTKIDDFGIHVDFDDLDDDLKEDPSSEREASLADQIANLTAELDKMAPNMRSADRLQATEERFRAVGREYDDAKQSASRASRSFEAVKEKRMDLFNAAFAHIQEQIGTVYRDLTKTASFPLGGQASLGAEEDAEPYLGGVKYHAMPPLKRFRDMELLSGGEKTMAALALLFAVHAFAPSPFFVLDEVDAALDHANTTQLAAYLRDHAAPGMQFVVISLKTGLFQNSETLVGIMRDQGVNSSKALTLDLRKYQTVP